MAKTQTRLTVLASTSKSAATTSRATLLLEGYDGGYLTPRITNGGTGPTAQCNCTLYVTHKPSSGSSVAATAAEGADWTKVSYFGGGTANSAFTERLFRFGPEIFAVQIEFSSHTGSNVTVECEGTGYNY